MIRRIVKTLKQNSLAVRPQYLKKKYATLVKKGRPGIYFFVMATSSAAIATMGFIMNSPSVIIGAMVISPLLYPVVLAGSALSQRQWHEFTKLIKLLGYGAVAVVTVSIALSLLIPFQYQSEIHGRLASSPLQYLVVAICSGIAGTFAYYWPRVSETITGVGISVALVPPFVMVGVAVGNGDVLLLSKSSLIVLLNVLGIMLGSMAAFVGIKRYAAR
ncbi:MAG: DUF389 domain-containing protein [Candidatus Saccharibacteria bacterium]|nr:DUF389 domain-containing protein [Candidatus Saccharibacteria bacterium]